MGKKKANVKESENGNHVTKLSESPVKNCNNSGRSKASVLASLFFIILIGVLSIILGLIFLEINSSSKDLNSGILKHDTIKKEATPHHVKESPSKASISEKSIPPPSPPSIPDIEKKMDRNKIKDSSDAADVEELPLKKQKQENIKKPEAPDKEFPIDKDKQIEIEKQIIQDTPVEIKKSKEKKISEKDEPSKPSASEGKSKAEEKPKKADDKTSDGAKSDATLKDLYIEVEGLADEILQEDPENSMVKELAPHLEGVLRDLEGGKLSGLRDSLLHIKIILSDLKERLQQSKHQKKSDINKLPKPDSVASKTEDVRVPVDEVIPDPIYIAPLGDTDVDVDRKPSDKPSGVKEEVTEKKTQDQPKKSSKVDEKSSQIPPAQKEKQQKSVDKAQEKKQKNIDEKVIVQSSKDPEKDPKILSKETIDKTKSKDDVQNINVVEKEREMLKDKPIVEKSGKEKSSEEKPSKVESDKRKESKKEVKAEKIKEYPTEEKLKTTEKVKSETKPSTIDKKQESDKKNLDVKQTKTISEKEESKKLQKDTVETLKQPSSESVQQEKSSGKSEENNRKLKDSDLPVKKLENEKVIEKQTKNEEKIPPKVETAKADSKESEVKEKSKEQNLKATNKEKQTVQEPSKNEKQTVQEPSKNEKHHLPNTDKQKNTKINEDTSSASSNTNEKTSSNTLKKNTEEAKSSETDEKLKLAAALEDEVHKSTS